MHIFKFVTSRMNQPAHLFFLLFTAGVLLISEGKEGANIKIINGDEVVPHSRPYMALIETRKNNKTGTCCGCLIKPDWVLTAAHCNLIPRKTIVTLGAHSKKKKEAEKQKMNVIKLYVYKPYNSNTKQYDIQLVQLSKKATLGKAVNTLPLPVTFEDLKKDTVCSIAGWGRTETGKSPDKLRETNITILDREKCKKAWKKKYVITTDMLCTKVGNNRKDTCKGDSGSPLICGGFFRGVNSFGYMPCGTPETSNVFTRLTKKYVSWIKDTIRYNSRER